jgi:hypothetical protein
MATPPEDTVRLLYKVIVGPIPAEIDTDKGFYRIFRDLANDLNAADVKPLADEIKAELTHGLEVIKKAILYLLEETEGPNGL